MILRSPRIALLAGLLLIVIIAFAGTRSTAPALAQRLEQRTAAVIDDVSPGSGVRALFVSPAGAPSRHPLLTGADSLNEGTRDELAKAIAALPGVGGVRWADGNALVESADEPVQPLHCQEDVEALLRARTIRFEEGSARIDAASRSLVDEVAQALRPCLGSIIAITGHTDTSGSEPGNLALSRERAAAVEQALVDSGIPADGLRARGVGSREPVEGLDPTDAANRRIEFSVLATVPISPTPVDTPGPR